MRGKYRSAIYTFDAAQTARAQTTLGGLQSDFDVPLVTRVLHFKAFKPSDERFQNYNDKNAGGPFCTRYIDPKLELLRKEYAGLLADS